MKRKNYYLCDRLYEWRKQNKVTQEEFADMVGVSRQTIQKWESGFAMPKQDKLQKISEIVGVEADELLLAPIDNQLSADVIIDESAPEVEIKKSKNDKKFKLSTKAKIIIALAVFILISIVGIFLVVYDKVIASSNSDGTVGTVEIVALNFSVENVGWILFGISIAVGVILGLILICKLTKNKKKENLTKGNEPKYK